MIIFRVLERGDVCSYKTWNIKLNMMVKMMVLKLYEVIIK